MQLLTALLVVALCAVAPARADDLQDASRLLKAGQPQQALERVNRVLAAKKNDPVRLGTIVATLVELLEALSVMIAPVMPVVAGAIRAQIGLSPLAPAVDKDQWPLALPARLPVWPAGSPRSIRR